VQLNVGTTSACQETQKGCKGSLIIAHLTLDRSIAIKALLVKSDAVPAAEEEDNIVSAHTCQVCVNGVGVSMISDVGCIDSELPLLAEDHGRRVPHD
jgi:hypothetical protein